MRIESVRVEGDELILHAPGTEARRFAYDFRPGNYDITKHRERRSNDANALMWALCRDIGQAVNLPDADVYKNAIREVGVYRDFAWTESEARTLRKAWEKLGIGWVTEQLDYTPDGDKLVIRCWYGSSTYNTKQMSRLIDLLIQDAEAVGIETPDSQRINSLLREWDEKHKLETGKS